jgi:hypothetical protein
MAAIFQIRRGTSANTSSLVNGELYLNTSENAFQVGTPTAGAPIKMLSLNTASFGDIILTGSAYISGNVVLGGTITIGDTTNDSVVFIADLSSSIIPDSGSTYDLGSSVKPYRNVYATSINGAIAATNGVVSGSSQITSILDSLNSFSGSQLTQNTALATISGSLIVTASANVISITNLNSFSGSQLTQNTALSTISGSLILTASANTISVAELNSFSSSQLTQNTALATITGSLILTASANTISLTEIHSYTSSLKTAFGLSGQNVTVNGNLTVNGTTTQIDSTTLNIGDNIIELNYGGSQTLSGIYTKDATGTLSSGSLLWNSTTDRWIAGVSGSESTILLAGGDSVISGSTQIANLGYATTGSNSFNGGQSINGNLYLTGSLIPSGNFVYDLGSATNGFGDVYLSSSTVYMNNNAIFGTTDVVPVNVGDYLQGGIVYYVDNVNGFSYIVNKDDIGEVDSSNFTRVAGANSSVLGGGITNTNAITASTGGQQNPAKLCSDFSGSGYTDWYLPSTRELALMASNTNLMGASLAGVRYFRYWSSTADSDASKTYYAGDDKTADDRFTSYGYGNSTMYSVPDNRTSVGYVKAVRRTNITEIIRTLSFPNFNFSGSINIAGTVDGIAIGAFVTQSNGRLTELESSSVNLNIVSSSLNASTASLNSFSASVTASLEKLYQTTASLNSFSASVTASLEKLYQTTASLNQTTASLNLFSASINFFSASIFTDFSNSYDAVSESFDYRITILDPGNIAASIVAINTFTSSANGRLNNIEAATSSYETTGRGIVSGSSQILGGSNIVSGAAQIVPLLPTGVISGSSQITTLLPSGVVSGSSQITYSQISSIPSEIVSGAAQIVPLLPTGVISGSSQILGGSGIFSGSSQVNADSITNFDTNVKDKLNVDGVISGSSQVASLLPSGVVSGSLQVLGGSTIHSGSSGDYQFNSIGVGTAASTVTGEIRATGDITAFYSSDIRLKENIQPIENALEKVNKISGNTYDWKEGYDEIHSHNGNDVGVIAQEIEQILPQIVTNRDNGYKAVQYEKIIPLLIEAIKELSAKVNSLEK